MQQKPTQDVEIVEEDVDPADGVCLSIHYLDGEWAVAVGLEGEDQQPLGALDPWIVERLDLPQTIDTTQDELDDHRLALVPEWVGPGQSVSCRIDTIAHAIYDEENDKWTVDVVPDAEPR